MPRKQLSKIKYLACLVGGLITCITLGCLSPHHASAASCPDLQIIFVRGSGATRYGNEDYQAFKSSLTLAAAMHMILEKAWKVACRN